MWQVTVFLVLCYGITISTSCHKKPEVATRSDTRFVDSSLPSTSTSYSEGRWNQMIDNNVDLSNFQNVRQQILNQLNQYDVDPFAGVPTDTGSTLGMNCNSLGGLCNCVLTLYSLGNPLHTGPLFYPNFNRETREVIQGSRSFSRYNYALDYALINRAYDNGRSTMSGALYRGVNVGFDGSLGDTFTFNQFTSASENEAVAIQFLTAGGTLFEIHFAEALSMSPVSQFTREEEYLIHPFEEFYVYSISRENTSAGRITRVVLVRQGYSFHDELLLKRK